jgi:hypothetical protein
METVTIPRESVAARRALRAAKESGDPIRIAAARRTLAALRKARKEAAKAIRRAARRRSLAKRPLNKRPKPKKGKGGGNAAKAASGGKGGVL